MIGFFSNPLPYNNVVNNLGLTALMLYNTPINGNFPLTGWKAAMIDNKAKPYFMAVTVDLQLCSGICPYHNCVPGEGKTCFCIHGCNDQDCYWDCTDSL